MSDGPAFGRKTSQRYKDTVHKNTQTSQIYYGSVRKPPLEFFFPKPLSESPSSECVHKLVSHTKMDARRCTDCAVCDQKSHSGAHRRCRDWVPITFEVITSVWRRFRHRDLGGSIRLDALHVIVLFVRPYAAYKGQKRSAPVRLRQWCSAPASARASASAPHRLRRTRPAAPPSPVAAPGGGPRE